MERNAFLLRRRPVRRLPGIAWFFAYSLLCCAAVEASKPTEAEMALSRRWAEEGFGDKPPAEPPFSFHYGGKASADLLPNWRVQRSSRQLDERRTQRTLVWTDPTTGLEVRSVAVQYRDFPIVEWTLYFKNAGAKNTP